MNVRATRLKEVLDAVLANKDLEKSDVDGDGDLDTKCNLGAQIIAEAFDYYGFIVDGVKGPRGLMANEMMALFEAEDRKHLDWSRWDNRSPEPDRGDWTECDGKAACAAAGMGILVFAACYGPLVKAGGKTARKSGHVAAVGAQGAMVYSTKWGEECPVVANIGQRNGYMGANFAFASKPRYFIFIRNALGTPPG